jgi:putative thioredoxin
LNQIDSAKQLLATINPKDTDYYAQARGLESVLYFKQEAQNLGDSELDRQFAQAASSVLEGEYELALKKFLEIVATSRKYKEDGARKAMLQIFTVLGENHPLTKEYQNQLMMTLY